MHVVPRVRVELRSHRTPAATLAALPLAVAEWNRRAALFGGLRVHTDADRVRVGYWPRSRLLRALNGGVVFEGRIYNEAGRSVFIGEIGIFPAWRNVLLLAFVLLALVVPVFDATRHGQALVGIVSGAFLAAALRIGVEFLFSRYSRGIQGVLHAAVAPEPRQLDRA